MAWQEEKRKKEMKSVGSVTSKETILINTIKIIIHPHTRRHLDGKKKIRRSSNWAIQYFNFLLYDV